MPAPYRKLLVAGPRPRRSPPGPLIRWRVSEMNRRIPRRVPQVWFRWYPRRRPQAPPPPPPGPPGYDNDDHYDDDQDNDHQDKITSKPGGYDNHPRGPPDGGRTGNKCRGKKSYRSRRTHQALHRQDGTEADDRHQSDPSTTSTTTHTAQPCPFARQQQFYTRSPSPASTPLPPSPTDGASSSSSSSDSLGRKKRAAILTEKLSEKLERTSSSLSRCSFDETVRRAYRIWIVGPVRKVMRRRTTNN